MNPFRSLPRRRFKSEFAPEQLETRELLTGGNNTFAIIPGTIAKSNGTADVSFTVDPANFTLPKRAITLGIDVVASSGSTVKPLIASVTDPHGTIVPQTFHSIYDPHLSHAAVAGGKGTSAVLSPLVLFPHGQTKPATYTVQVQAYQKSSGDFLLGFYLPGDVNGDGKVDKTDLAAVKKLQGTKASSPNYNFNADANRDGRIGKIDVAFTLQNQGISTNISPVVQADYDSANDINPLNPRTTATNTAHFTGTASPGSTITYTQTDNTVPVTTTTADSMGNYSVTVPLAAGANTFQVSSSDAFGQKISGTIAPVNFIPSSSTVTPSTVKTTT